MELKAGHDNTALTLFELCGFLEAMLLSSYMFVYILLLRETLCGIYVKQHCLIYAEKITRFD